MSQNAETARRTVDIHLPTGSSRQLGDDKKLLISTINGGGTTTVITTAQ